MPSNTKPVQDKRSPGVLRGSQQARIPDELPGDFFVLAWDKLDEVFALHVDDGEESSYNLGADIGVIRLRFKLWGLDPHFGDKVIDVAREFGACQAIPAQDRTIAIYEKPKQPELQFHDGNEDQQHVVLPPLR